MSYKDQTSTPLLTASAPVQLMSPLAAPSHATVGSNIPPSPSLTYVDIMPRILNPGNLDCDIAPTFDTYSSTLAMANEWLLSNRHLIVWKCETVAKKVSRDLQIDIDSMLEHDSTCGANVYAKGIRMWLVPNVDSSSYPQQLATFSYIPVIVDFGETVTMTSLTLGMTKELKLSCKRYESLRESLDAINEKLRQNPLPGKILNIETSYIKVRKGYQRERVDPECMCRYEIGRGCHMHLQIIRILYLNGSPQHELIDIYDALPDIVSKPNLTRSTKFASFTDTVYKAGMWIQQQKNIQIVNIQTHESRVEQMLDAIEIDSNVQCFEELSLQNSTYIKGVRVFYVKSATYTLELPSSMCLCARLFIPVRWGQKSYELMANTIWRMTEWLRVTGMPVIGVETVKYLMTNMSRGNGLTPEKCDTHIQGSQSKYWITAIRLYFPSLYQEPLANLLPPTGNEWTSSENTSNVCMLL